MKRCFRAVLILMASLLVRAEAADWRPGKAPLMTRWAADVGPTNALPEYPRPQLVRPDWMNLNGLWDYAITADSVERKPAFAGKILVPFPVESALSGVMTNLGDRAKVWYRRSFSLPESWRGKRVRLHFGAVNWRCGVSINGREIGRHQGGYDGFTFDITDAVSFGKPNEVGVWAVNALEGDHPRGKQSRKPEGIFYTASSGIWQTVWLEPTPATCIDRLTCAPDPGGKAVRLRVAANSRVFSEDLRVEATAFARGEAVGAVAGAANGDLVLTIRDPRLWSPQDPFLYDLKVTLKAGAQTVDSVSSYFGMRTVALRKDDQDVTRIALNDKPVFGIGTLDQGFWPDGIYTAPTDAALRWDIEFLKKAGFNFTRKHMKVEPDRWYYWCDRLGLLVWQDMPSGDNATEDGRRDFESELLRMVDGLENHPSVIVWVLFNEGWGQYDTKPLAAMLRERDPSRLVDNASGWTDMRVGDLVDMHDYPGPDSPAPEPLRAAALGEFGGLGLSVTNHLWANRSWGYIMLRDSAELASRYTQALKQVGRLRRMRGLSAVVYTQTADVETECNGFQTYDRAVAKIDPEILLAANRGGAFSGPEKVVLANGLFGRASWNYTTEKPGEDWFEPGFDASSWKAGLGGFGSTGTPGIVANTTWSTADIWLRREFTMASEDRSGIKLHVFHDEDAEIYLNGVLASRLTGFITDYDEIEISSLALASLHAGTNTIAVHCSQTTGGQGIDVGLIRPTVATETSVK